MLSVVALISSQWIQSAATFCRQLAAWVPDMLSYFYLLKINAISNNSITIEAGEKVKYLKSSEFSNSFNV
jgi:hypothetical protein